jgi:hypothetical protein
LIISYHDAFSYKGEGYDQVQNTERLTHNLSRLLEAYKKAKIMLSRGEINPEDYTELVQSKAEVFSYFIIATSGSLDGVQEIISADLSEYSLEAKSRIKTAIDIRSTIESNNA